eukprot:10499746-Prorocentrum_lima.AAC.1
MTSSLVGSEMCIRDSSEEEGLNFDPQQFRTEAVIAKNCLTTVGQYTPIQAVSYTHLTLPTICSV